MRKTWKLLALTVAGCGGLAAPARVAPARPNEIRPSVAEVTGETACPAAGAVRDAVLETTDFDDLLGRLRREALPASGLARHGEDSLQDALLKVWRSRPELFLMEQDELVRYLRTAIRRNAITLAAKDRMEPLEAAEAAASTSPGPQSEAEAIDLLEALVARLEREEQVVLEALLQGVDTVRDLAGELERTRYAVTCSLDRIERELERLVAGDS